MFPRSFCGYGVIWLLRPSVLLDWIRFRNSLENDGNKPLSKKGAGRYIPWFVGGAFGLFLGPNPLLGNKQLRFF